MAQQMRAVLSLLDEAHTAKVNELWDALERRRAADLQSGALEARRAAHRVSWLWSRVDSALREDFRAHPAVRAALDATEDAVRRGTLTPEQGAARLIDAYGGSGADAR